MLGAVKTRASGGSLRLMWFIQNAWSKQLRSWGAWTRGRARHIRGNALTTAAIAAIVACGPASAKAACTKVPISMPKDRILLTHTTLRVPAGSTVYVVLIKNEGLNGPGFPWQTPRSSNNNVLAPVQLCKTDRPSSLTLTVTGFRAVKPGKATLTAPLVRRWRSRTNRPRPASDRVTVT